MSKIGFLSKNKANGKTYIYLRTSQRSQDDYKKVIKKNIFSFGSMPGALEKMYHWRENIEKFPADLLGKGYNLDDLDEWILTLETKITKNGKRFVC